MHEEKFFYTAILILFDNFIKTGTNRSAWHEIILKIRFLIDKILKGDEEIETKQSLKLIHEGFPQGLNSVWICMGNCFI